MAEFRASPYTGIMIFLHAYAPTSIAFVLGPLSVHWYGIVMAMAMLAAIGLAMLLSRYYGLVKELIADLAVWLLVGGLVGARLYEIGLEWPYYSLHPGEVLQVWHGGLAIHGALLGGALALLIFARRRKLEFWKLAAVCAPAVALGQAIGRWGNWFNQELFGRPTAAAWGIPIDYVNRPAGYEMFSYFHPTFLYESLGCLLIAVILTILVIKKIAPTRVLGIYAIMYGLLRFALEFIKIDVTPVFLGLRWPQIASILLVLIGFWLVCQRKHIDS